MAAVPGSLSQRIERAPWTELAIFAVTSIVVTILIHTLNGLVLSGTLEWSVWDTRLVSWGLAAAFWCSALPLAYWAVDVYRGGR